MENFEPKFNPNMEKQNTPEKEIAFEVLKTPEISVSEEPNAQLLSFILNILEIGIMILKHNTL